MNSILDYETVALVDEDDAIEIIDQTKLPGITDIIRLHTAQEIWDAIYLLQVRGAPAIGVAAAIGLYVPKAMMSLWRICEKRVTTSTHRDQQP